MAARSAPLRSRLSPSMEDYLKEVYLVGHAAGVVTTQALATRLGITAPSVTQMVKRLDAQGLVRRVPYRGVQLTTAGERVAREVIRHHRLLERYLTEWLGCTHAEAHEEAERLEHHISETFEARIASLLGYPTPNPHEHAGTDADGTMMNAGGACQVDPD